MLFEIIKELVFFTSFDALLNGAVSGFVPALQVVVIPNGFDPVLQVVVGKHLSGHKNEQQNVEKYLVSRSHFGANF